jgi:OOP family OmpA-OmpF porin
MRGSRGFLVKCSSVLSALVGVLFASTAGYAQDVPNDQFSVNRFSPALGGGNYVQVDGAAIGGHMTPSLELLIDYAHRPFVLYTASCPGGNSDECEIDDSEVEIVSYQLTFDLGATLTLWQKVQFGLLVPLVYTTGDSFAATTGPALADDVIRIPGGEAFGLGDPRLSGKMRFLGKGSEGFSLGGLVFVTLPLGNAIAEGHNMGNETVTGGGHVIAEYRMGRLRGAANLGGVLAPERTLLSTTRGSEMTYGAGAGFDITALLSVVTEIAGATRFTSDVDDNPLEWRLAGKLAQGDFVFQLGGGAGLISGVGVPNFRIIGGAAYQPAGLDADGDGVADATDSCPSAPEDKDGNLDDDGCPDGDNDGDGVDDKADKCPDDGEDPDGFEDQDGCPDRDNDADGIQDGYDSCPDQPEDKDGDRDTDGCPDNDRDRDGVDDDKDKCPEQPEDTDGFGDEDGCPEADFDGDTIPDDQDQCPDQVEDADGFEDEDGCPEEGGSPDAAPGRRRAR